MTTYETIAVVIPCLSLGISFLAIFLSVRASNSNKKMFKRQQVIDLHMAWEGTNEIDPNNLITSDIIKASNTLTLTATMWNHDVIEKAILYQSYWQAYKQLYVTLKSINNPIPGMTKIVSSLITSEIDKAYVQMKSMDMDAVTQTKI